MKTVELAPHAYGPGATREETEAIADRVSIVDERVLLIYELPVQSPFSVNLMFDRVARSREPGIDSPTS